MKTAELTELGLDEAVIPKVLALAGRDIEKLKTTHAAEITALTTERDNLQTQLTDAQSVIDKLDGKDPDELKQEILSYQQRAADAETNFKAQLLQRDQKAWLETMLGDKHFGVKSPYARKQIITDVMDAKKGLQWRAGEDGKPGMFMGFDDYMKQAKEADPTLYTTPEEKEQQEQADNQPQFTDSAGNTEKGGGSGKKFQPPLIF